jgi:carbon monoxide dehydrogenase subunit G
LKEPLLNTYEKTIRVHAPASAVLAILTDVAKFAEWNPAISPMAAAAEPTVVGRAYRTLIRNVVPAKFTYTEISPTTVAHTLAFPGFNEDAVWRLAADGEHTRVMHRFTQSGPASRVIPAGASDVVGLRVSRLKDRSERVSSAD